MKQHVKTAFKRYGLLTKRLFCKPGFLLILLLVPLLVAVMSAVSAGGGGIVTVALTAEDTADPDARDVIDKLTSDTDSIVRYVLCDTPDEAQSKVVYGKADGAWIISAGIGGKIDDYVAKKTPDGACVRMIEREDSVALKLVREKLSAVISEYLGLAAMKHYAAQNLPEMDGVTDAGYREYFSAAFGNEQLFEFSYVERTEDTGDIGLDILMLPARGLLAVTVVLGGLACAMYYMKDEDAGTFYRVYGGGRPFFAVVYQLTGVVPVAVAALITLIAAGISVSPLREVAATALFTASCTAFCILVRRLCGRLGRLGALTPPLIVALIVISPIFFTMAEIRPIQMLTPTYYYMMAIHSPIYLLYSALYALALAVADYLIYKLTDRA